MEEKKPTDEEIVKALECCTVDEVTDCENCPLVRESCAIIRKYALDLIHRQKAEIEELKKDYIKLDLECRNLRTELDKELAEHEEFTKKAKEEIERLTEELKDLDWYKMWHKKFKKEIDDLTLELETYRPTKLSGNGQCKCSNCGGVSWTDWFSRYKGKILCDKCLKEIITTERKASRQRHGERDFAVIQRYAYVL